MKILIIDTSTSQSFVTLSKKGELTTLFLPSKHQSRELIAKIEELIQGEAIDCIAVGTGPGSFTGTRVGVMAAKALAFSMDIPLVPFCSLKIFTPSEGAFILVGDAKSRGSYLLEGKWDQGEVSFGAPYLGEKRPSSTTLNLPFLASYLEKKFHAEDPASHRDIRISYL